MLAYETGVAQRRNFGERQRQTVVHVGMCTCLRAHVSRLAPPKVRWSSR